MKPHEIHMGDEGHLAYKLSGFIAMAKMGAALGWLFFWLILGAPLFCGPQAYAQETRTALPLKAAFITKFVEFVEWPSPSFPDDAAPIIIGIVGEDPMSKELTRILKEVRFKTHPFQLVHYKDAKEIKNCHMLFVSPAEMPQLSAILAQIQKKPILTIGDASAFSSKGGMINFIEVENKLRFQINLEAVQRAGLKINSKLVKVSVLVKEEKLLK